MVKKVGFDFLYINKEDAVLLKEKLVKEGMETADIFRTEGKGEKKILITDNQKGEQWAFAQNCPCLGVERKERLTTKYITESEKWITRSYLDRVYRRFYGIPWDILETERIFLREMTVEDLKELYSLYRGAEITRYIEPLYEDIEKEMVHTLEHIGHMYGFFEYGMWLVVLKEGEKIIGRAGICNREINGITEPELGYIIGKDYQKQGYGMEACKGILAYAKEELSMDFLNCFIEKENYKSIALAEKLGFEKVQEEKIKNLLWYRKNL